jgi:hypothetical protein
MKQAIPLARSRAFVFISCEAGSIIKQEKESYRGFLRPPHQNDRIVEYKDGLVHNPHGVTV